MEEEIASACRDQQNQGLAGNRKCWRAYTTIPTTEAPYEMKPYAHIMIPAAQRKTKSQRVSCMKETG
jgi:hypothetical protein